MFKKYLTPLFITILSVFILSACQSTTALDSQESLSTDSDQETSLDQTDVSEDSTDQDADLSTSDNLTPFSIGLMSDMGSVPFLIAQEQGYFEEQGLDVDLQVFTSAVDRDTAFQTGNLDLAMSDMLTIIFLQDGGFNAKMTSMTTSNYKMVSSPSVTESDFSQLDQIEVGISSNTVIDFMTGEIASSADFEDRLVKTAIPQMPVRLQMLSSGELTAATLPDPLASSAQISGGYVISSSEEIGMEPGIMIASEDALNSKSQALSAVYKAYDEAVDYINQTDYDSLSDLLVDQLSFPENLKGNFTLPQYPTYTAPDESTFNEALSWMQENDLTENTYLYEDLFQNPETE